MRQLIVNVLIFHALGIEPVIDPADTVLENFPVRDGLLCGLRPGLSCRGLLLGFTVRPYKTDNFYAFLSRKEEHPIADQYKDRKAGRRKKAS